MLLQWQQMNNITVAHSAPHVPIFVTSTCVLCAYISFTHFPKIAQVVGHSRREPEECSVHSAFHVNCKENTVHLGLTRRSPVQAIGREARAMYNLGQAEGLTIWSPNVNIFRDPRWGRGQETPGEDPTTASKYAVAFVRGIQGSSRAGAGTSPLQASACCKHATAYDLEDWNGVQRYNFDARVTAQDLADTFNPPFRSCVVDGKATCVMCAYTGVNGVPACASSDLLTKTFRGEWGLDGYVSSDCDAVAIMRDAQRYAPTPEDTVAVALKAGKFFALTSLPKCLGVIESHVGTVRASLHN
jgi:hypothetical protein